MTPRSRGQPPIALACVHSDAVDPQHSNDITNGPPSSPCGGGHDNHRFRVVIVEPLFATSGMRSVHRREQTVAARDRVAQRPG